MSRGNKSGNLSIPDVTSIKYPDLDVALDFLIAHHADFARQKKGTSIKWLLWVVVNALYGRYLIDQAGIEIGEPIPPGGLRVDKDDPLVKARLENQAAIMRAARAQKNIDAKKG